MAPLLKLGGRQRKPSELELLFPIHRYRKLRLYFAWPFVIVIAIFARSTVPGFWLGAALILLGEGIRIWAHGYLRKARKLATSGPYAYVRNPLYLGNFLIGIGFCAIVWHLLLALVFTIGFASVYGVTIKGEEERLYYKFKEQYLRYQQSVPCFLPRLSAYWGGQGQKFKAHRVWGHGEHITVLAILVCFLSLYLRHQLYQEATGFSWDVIVAFVFTLSLGLFLLVSMFDRWSKGRR